MWWQGHQHNTLLVAVMLRNVDLCYRFLACGFLGCRFPAGCLSFICACHEDSARFSTLKIDGQVCDAFSTCGIRTATCGVDQWVLNTQCRSRKAGWDLETRLEYRWAEPSGLEVLNQLHVESNSKRSRHQISHYALTSMWSGYTYACGVQGMIWLHIHGTSHIAEECGNSQPIHLHNGVKCWLHAVICKCRCPLYCLLFLHVWKHAGWCMLHIGLMFLQTYNYKWLC